MVQTTIISDGLRILVGYWNIYFTSRNPDPLLQGFHVVQTLMAFSKEYYTNDEIDFMNRYVSEYNHIFRDDYYDFSDDLTWSDTDAS
tara:strand:- start:260 stop:520 length:261 start_codon:yes stop_codon:yes gene_type:complete